MKYIRNNCSLTPFSLMSMEGSGATTSSTIVASAFIGGARAQAGGGKFLNGAAMGAFGAAVSAGLNEYAGEYGYYARQQKAQGGQSRESKEVAEIKAGRGELYGPPADLTPEGFSLIPGWMRMARERGLGGLYPSAVILVAARLALSVYEGVVWVGRMAYQGARSLYYSMSTSVMARPIVAIETVDFFVGRHTPQQALMTGPGGMLGTMSSYGRFDPKNYEYRWLGINK